MNINQYTSIYFLGIGGIGMSALARYFMRHGKSVSGYDRVSTSLTQALEGQGIVIHYTDDCGMIGSAYKDAARTLIIYTPAIPQDHSEYVWFQSNGFTMLKRAQVLGLLTRATQGLCVSGTHGKTTTSTLTAHLFHQSHLGCNAFLGGISNNYDTNLLLNTESPYTVIEADEYDRSFHTLTPYQAVITSVDPDHLDIYGTEQAYRDSFVHFTSLIQTGGALVMKWGLPIEPQLAEGVSLYTYSVDQGDFHADNIVIANGEIFFDFVTPTSRVSRLQLGVPIYINIENAVAALALGWLNGVTEQEMRSALAGFRGIKRRFDFQIKSSQVVYIDDYAHHPDELRASISSVKQLYPERLLTGIFQPHLYSRTQSFYEEFASSLSLLDQVVLLDIYPARELPIDGVSSSLIFDLITQPNKWLIHKSQLLDWLSDHPVDILLTLGAGDIDQLVTPITRMLSR